MSAISLPDLPSPLSWHGQPSTWDWTPNAQLDIIAGAKTDWFNDPQGTYHINNAPALLFKSQAPCLLSAHVTVNHAATFDAGALAIYVDTQVWAKLCLELSPQGQLTVVSVVTKEVSDDCNSFGVEGRSAYLRMARRERSFAFHHSSDGATWSLIRHFALGDHAEVQIGFFSTVTQRRRMPREL